MILSQIAACSANRVIGTQGDLPWNIPEDMSFFREKTKGHIMIMGRKTFDSFGGKPLPKRVHIVVSRSSEDLQFEASAASPVIKVSSLEQAFAQAALLQPAWPEEVFIIGGGEIYRQTLEISDVIYLTMIEKEFEGDTYFPAIPDQLFKRTEHRPIKGPIDFSFNTFKKIQSQDEKALS
jgi:dihydrofolate reductase